MGKDMGEKSKILYLTSAQIYY